MSRFDQAALTTAAGVDPWALATKLTTGNPYGIYDLARAFAAVAGDQQAAAEYEKKALAAVAAGYRVDQRSVVDDDVEARSTVAALGDGGAHAMAIAKQLGVIGDELTKSTMAAKKVVSALEDKIRSLVADFNKAIRELQMAGRDVMMSHSDAEYFLDMYVRKAVDAVEDAAKPINDTIAAYEQVLAAASKAMADLGYIPDNLEEGADGSTMDEEQARRDAARFNQGLTENGPNGLADIAAGERNVVLINDKIAHGQPLTAAERAYLKAWYEAVGADNLAALPGYVKNHTQPGEPVDANVGAYVSPVADGIMNLSKPYVATDSEGLPVVITPAPGDMPQSVKDLVHQRAGYVALDGVRVPNKYYTEGVLSRDRLGVDGGDRYGGFADLMDAATIEGGREFTVDLAAGALQFKQDLNAIKQTVVHDAGTKLPGNAGAQFAETVSKDFDASNSDAAPSEILDVVSRNRVASQDLILDSQYRDPLLGAQWDHDAGVSHVVATATKREQGSPEEARRAAQSAQAILEDLSSDPYGWRSRIDKGSGLSDMLTHVATEYVDSFTAEPDRTVDDPANAGVADGQGHYMSTFGLSAAHRTGFLEFLAAGPHPDPVGDPDMQKFQVAADMYTKLGIAQALMRGDDHAAQIAANNGGNLQGAIAAAEVNAYTHGGVSSEEAYLLVYRNQQFALLMGDEIMRNSAHLMERLFSASLSQIPVVGPFIQTTLDVSYDDWIHATSASQPEVLALQLQNADNIRNHQGSLMIAHRAELFGEAKQLAGDTPPPGADPTGSADSVSSYRAWAEKGLIDGNHERWDLTRKAPDPAANVSGSEERTQQYLYGDNKVHRVPTGGA